MKKIIFLLLLFAAPSAANAGYVSCVGSIDVIMADHVNCVDENGKKQLAFKIGGYTPWLCNGSDSSSSFVLSMAISEKQISVYIPDTTTCETHAWYLKPSYTFRFMNY